MRHSRDTGVRERDGVRTQAATRRMKPSKETVVRERETGSERKPQQRERNGGKTEKTGHRQRQQQPWRNKAKGERREQRTSTTRRTSQISIRPTSTTAKALLLARQSAAPSASRSASATLPGSRLAAFDKKASNSGFVGRFSFRLGPKRTGGGGRIANT